MSRRTLVAVSDGRLLRALAELESQGRLASDTGKVAKLTLRIAASLFRPDAGCLALTSAADAGVAVQQSIGVSPGDLLPKVGAPGGRSSGDKRHQAPAWDLVGIAGFVRGEKVAPDPCQAMARLKRRGRAWGAIVLRWDAFEPDWQVRNALTQIAAAANRLIEDIEGQRLAEVRGRIDRKIMEQLRPKDLFYQIIDGLRSLTGYDHSAVLLTMPSPGERPGDGSGTAPHSGPGHFEIAAEQLAWRKGRSRRVGRFVPAPADLETLFTHGRAWCFRVQSGVLTADDPGTPAGLAQWLSRSLGGDESDRPEECEIICAPLHIESRLVAVLRLSAASRGVFDQFECDLVEQLLPQATIAIQNARRTERLEEEVLQAERKHAMADLARGVSHDVNNALGAVLPLVQQMREDVRAGRTAPDAMLADLAQIERSVQTCRRIFGGMLSFARSSQPEASPSASVALAVDGAMGILADSLARHRVETRRTITDELPQVAVPQIELERVMINLIGNARDAMRQFGRGMLSISAATDVLSNRVRIEVCDTGEGVPAHLIPRLFEPFFTTKPAGSGLGLALCRSIIASARGEIRCESPAFHAPPTCPMTGQSLGLGARFICMLPAYTPSPEPVPTS